MPNRERSLTWNTVTEGSVIILPGYPALFIAVGTILLAQSPERTSSPAFDTARFIMGWTPEPIHSWGIVFLVLGVAEAIALLVTQDRNAFKWLLVPGTGVVAAWAIMLLFSATQSPLVTFTGSAWVFFVSLAHLASIRSLTRDLVVKK